MAKPPPIEAVPPSDFAETSPPRDLHPTTDIRFVMKEMATLVAKVDRLVDDIRDHGSKIDELRHNAVAKLDRVIDDTKEHGKKIDDLRVNSVAKLDRVVEDSKKHDGQINDLVGQSKWLKGGIAFSVVIISAIVIFVGWLVNNAASGKFDALLTAIHSQHH